MSLLFVHSSEKIKEDNEGNLYISGAYSAEVFNRYFQVSKDLTVIFRKENTKVTSEYAKRNLEKFDYEKINFIEYSNLNTSIVDFINIKKRIKNKKLIENAVKKADKIIVRLPCPAGYDAIKYAKKHKKIYMVEVVGCVFDALYNLNYKGKILAFPIFLKMRKAIKDAPYAIYVTDKFLQKRYPNKFLNISCSDVVIPELDENVLQRRINKIEAMNRNNSLFIATIGAINVRYKGQEYVIKAIKRLKKENINVKYYIIGGGDNKYLLNLVRKLELEDNVIFTGAITHEKVFEYLDNIDIYVQPSSVEGLSRAVIEAMSRACPIIVSDAGGNPELISDRQFVFKSKDTKQLVKCIRKMTKDQMVQQANNNFKNAKKYDMNILENKRKNFYENLK